MTIPSLALQARTTRIIFGPGSFRRLGEVAVELGFRKTLLVADRGLKDAGHVPRAMRLMITSGIQAYPYHDFDPNPDSEMAARGAAYAATVGIDSIIGLGGGSSLDCAKAINFLLTNGGEMRDYWGYGKANHPMLPSLAVPTTTGTGSEAQSYALISDAETRVKMACGDPKASFKVAILDPELALSQPFDVRAAAGYDAISHAVETFVCVKRNPLSLSFSREAWRHLDPNFEKMLASNGDVEVAGAMLLGAHCAGAAIEHSMLGATHACANPLTQRFGTPHGVAIGILLAHVVRWNGAERYRELSPNLPARLDDLARAAKLPRRLSEIGVPQGAILAMANEAEQQWTGRFNPRPFDAKGAQEIYQCAF